MKYGEINKGAVYSFERAINKKDILAFAELSGDFNKLHVDPDFGGKSQFKSNIAHGMLAASLFSTLIGMHCPGENALYLSQTLNFRAPIFPGDILTVKGTVTGKNDSIRVISIKTEILNREKVIISGEAKVKVLNDE